MNQFWKAGGSFPLESAFAGNYFPSPSSILFAGETAPQTLPPPSTIEAAEIGVSWSRGRADKGFLKISTDSNKAFLKDMQADSGLWDLYFIGKQREHPKFEKFTGPFQEKLLDDEFRARFLHDYQLSLFSVRNDSVSVTLLRILLLTPS